MAVGAYELALRDLVENALTAAATGEDGDVCVLGKPRKVIPLHRGGMEDTTAVGARTSSLELDIPLQERSMPPLVLGHSTHLVRLIVGRRVLALARLTPWLQTVVRAVELAERSVATAAAAVLRVSAHQVP